MPMYMCRFNLILIFLIISILVLKYLKISLIINALLNFIAIGLLVYPIITIARTELIRSNGQKNKVELKVEENVFTKPANVEKPDIYYIILDGYGREDVLKSVYGYDNASFLNELENRNFFITRKSRANYAQTLLSLSRTLNMNYLNPFKADSANKEIYRHKLSSEIMNNSVTSFLKKLNYEIVTFATGYSGTEIKNSDLYIIPSFSLDEFQMMLVGMTPLYQLLEAIPNKSPIYQHRQRIIATIQKIPDIKSQAAPMFLFAHIVAPHPPFVLSKKEKYIERLKNRGLGYSDGSHYHSFNKFLMVEYTLRKLYLTIERDKKFMISWEEKFERSIRENRYHGITG